MSDVSRRTLMLAIGSLAGAAAPPAGATPSALEPFPIEGALLTDARLRKGKKTIPLPADVEAQTPVFRVEIPRPEGDELTTAYGTRVFCLGHEIKNVEGIRYSHELGADSDWIGGTDVAVRTKIEIVLFGPQVETVLVGPKSS